MYGGTQFRSRLEAKWAAFFDLAGWDWEYEPIDLNGYIPDFVLGFKEPLIVEVKPFLGSPFDWDKQEHEATAVLEKIVESGWRGEGLLVGAALWTGPHAMGWVDSGGDPINAGLLFDTRISIGEHSLIEQRGLADRRVAYASPFGFKECCGGPVDVVGSFHCRKCGHHDEGPTLVNSQYLQNWWREAGNRVQWRSPRGHK